MPQTTQAIQTTQATQAIPQIRRSTEAEIKRFDEIHSQPQGRSRLASMEVYRSSDDVDIMMMGLMSLPQRRGEDTGGAKHIWPYEWYLTVGTTTIRLRQRWLYADKTWELVAHEPDQTDLLSWVYKTLANYDSDDEADDARASLAPLLEDFLG